VTADESAGISLRPQVRSPARTKGARATRTTELILQAAREVFRERGYAGASIDAIAVAAGTSRASVYTYFRSKRDILITLGIANNERFQTLVGGFARLPIPLVHAQVADWAGDYLDFLDYDQSFTSVWHEAGGTDEMLRVESMRQYSRAWRTLGEALARSSGRPAGELDGMLLVGAFERAWFFWRGMRVDTSRERLIDHLTRLVLAVAS
jgi:AcrR family transcriptional regulator